MENAPQTSLGRLLKISRPAGWFILPAIFFAGAWFSLGAAYFPVQTVLIALALSLPMSLHGYGLNDIYDLESDRVNPRKKVLIHTSSDIRRTKILATIGGLSVILAAASTLQWVTTILSVSLVLVSYAYSVPPIRLRNRPPLDSIANGVGYFLLPSLLGWSLHRPLSQLPIDVYAIAIAVAGIHSFASIMDYSADKSVKHRTAATLFGKRGAAAICILAMAVCYLLFPFWYPLMGIALGLVITVHPNETLAKWGTRIFYLTFIAMMVAYYYFLITHLGNPFWTPGGLFAR